MGAAVLLADEVIVEPFTDINKMVEAQFAGKTFPEDGSGSVDVTVKRASVAASGNSVLISLLVSA